MKRIGICLILLMMLVIMFHPFIISQVATWWLQSYVSSHWGKPFQYEKIYLEGSRLVIVRPQFDHQFSFQAKQIVIGCHCHLWKRELKMAIEVSHPHWNFPAQLPLKEKGWKKFISHQNKWLKISSAFQVEKGSLQWTMPDASSHQLLFDTDVNSQQGGILHLYFDPSSLSDHDLAITGRVDPDQKLVFDFHYRDVEVPSLIQAMQFFGMDMASLKVSSGSLTGKMQVELPHGQRGSCTGDLWLQRCTFHLSDCLTGQIKQARLRMGKDYLTGNSGQAPSILGQIDLLQPATLRYAGQEEQWALHKIQGHIQLDDSETAIIHLQAREEGVEDPSQWHLSGHANLNSQQGHPLELSLSCGSASHPHGHIHFLLSGFHADGQEAEIAFHQFSLCKWPFFQHLFSPFWAIFSDLGLKQGELNGLMKAKITKQGIEEVHLKKFQVKHLHAILKPLGMLCQCEEAHGWAKINLSEQEVWSSFEGEVYLKNGNVGGASSFLPHAVNGHLAIKQGKIERSLINLEVAGLKGSVGIEWGERKQLITAKLEGMVQEVTEHFPWLFSQKSLLGLSQDRLSVVATIKQSREQLDMKGTCHFQQASLDPTNCIHFGCKWKEATPLQWMPTGWFYAPALALEKFVSPFIFSDGKTCLRGEARVKGQFDHRKVSFSYDAKDVHIENDQLCLEASHLTSSLPDQFLGYHEIDLQTGRNEGSLPFSM